MQLAELSDLPMLYNAWKTGNLPLYMIDQREFELIMAFDSGVTDTQDKGYSDGSFAVDPLDAFPEKAVRFDSKRGKDVGNVRPDN